MKFKMFKKIKSSDDLTKSIELIERKKFYSDISEISKTLKSIEKILSAKRASDVLGAYLKVENDNPLPQKLIKSDRKV